MAPRRRADDDPDGSFDPTKLRNGDSHTRWVVVTVSAALITALSWLIVSDRNQVERRIQALENVTQSIASEQAARRAEGDARWDEIKRTLDRIESRVRSR